MIMTDVIESAESNTKIYHLACLSHRLRDVVTRMPAFWSKIVFSPEVEKDFSGFRKVRPQGREFALCAWFLASAPKHLQNIPLDIIIQDNAKMPLEANHLIDITNILRRSRAGNLNLWRSIRIDVSCERILRDLSGHLGGIQSCHPVPQTNIDAHDASGWKASPANLQTLILRCKHGSQRKGLPMSFLSGHSFPRLISATIARVNIDWPLFSDQIRAGTLQELHLEAVPLHPGTDFAGFVRTLSITAPLLHSLTLSHMGTPIPSERQSANVPTLSRLRRLELVWCTPCTLPLAAELLTSMRLPSLSELILTDTAGASPIRDEDGVYASAYEHLKPLIDALSAWPYNPRLKALQLSGLRLRPGTGTIRAVLIANFRSFFLIPVLQAVEILTLRHSDELLIESLRPGFFINPMPNIQDLSIHRLITPNRRLSLPPHPPNNQLETAGPHPLQYHQDGHVTLRHRPQIRVNVVEHTPTKSIAEVLFHARPNLSRKRRFSPEPVNDTITRKRRIRL
jgi:hypothetical protein